MSKSIIIQQSGFPEALIVDALRTSKLGGGSEDWLPADGKNLVELDIGGSGTYRGSDYGAYGIAMARVMPKYGGGATSKAAQQPEFGNLHTPSIQEGGKPVLLSARLLKTNLQGGGTCLWVPEDEVNLDTKYVDRSGTYTARADGCYGYSQITVSGVDVEIKKDDDGDDVAEITDGGETRKEKLPSEIRIENELDFVGPYNEGDNLIFNGIIVKGYTASGKLWSDANHPGGVIPLSELNFSPAVAHCDGTIIGSNDDAYILPSGMIVYGFSMSKYGSCYQWRARNLGVTSFSYAPYFLTSDAECSGILVKEGGGVYDYYIYKGHPTNVTNKTESTEPPSPGPGPIQQRIWHQFIMGYMYRTEDITISPVAPEIGSGEDYGITLGMTVHVSWNRPYDERLLGTAFQAEIIQDPSQSEI